jgi:hypothetical protein
MDVVFKRWVFLAALFLLPSFLRADQVIMKSGKIYKGRIMGETNRMLLFRDTREAEPRFLAVPDILTIVRESRPAARTVEPKRYVVGELGISGAFFTARRLASAPGGALHLGGGFRLHPLVEVDGDLDWFPSLSGGLGITDGARFRGYERFWAYDGGFFARVFPTGLRDWRTEPYLLAGYQWSHWVPKESGDSLKGNVWRFGGGVQRPLWGALFWDARIL